MESNFTVLQFLLEQYVTTVISQWPATSQFQVIYFLEEN